MPFSKLGLSKHLLQQITASGLQKPYPIQENAIPKILAGKDLLGIAKTGSGKTAAYVWPLLTLLEKPKTKRNRFIRSLILVPTRELAEQIKDVIYEFSSGLPYAIKTLAVYGGVSINPQMQKMSGTDILVATPGRLLDLLSQNALRLTDLEHLILDEADKMLNLGFKDEMDKILSFMPTKRQNLLFSATLNENIDEITQLILRNPVVVKLNEEENNLEHIDQIAYALLEEEKGPFLRKLIAENDWQQVLVFVSSTHVADKVAHKLCKNDIHAASIHSKKTQGARTEALRKFKTGHLRVLVATDLLARGIDIDFLPYVVNYELPRSPKDYVHRIGRTGRAENPGKAISFITAEDAQHFNVIQKKMKKKVEILSIK